MTNSHEELHKIVTQKEKDRTVTGTVTAQQTVAGDLKSTVTQLEKDRTVTNAVAANLKAQVSQPTAANFKATVTQAEKDRTVTNPTAVNLKAEVFQSVPTNLRANIEGSALAYQSLHHLLKAQVKVTDETNFMPTMDAVGRPGFVKITDGVKTVGGIYDNITGKFSIASSRGAGKSSHTGVFSENQIELHFISPSLGKKLMICGIITAIDADTGDIYMDFVGAGIPVWRHYGARFKNMCGMDMSIIGDVNDDLMINSTQGENDIFILVNYREID